MLTKRLVRGPFNSSQKQSMNEYQFSEIFAPVSCDACKVPMRAYEQGWECPGCYFTMVFTLDYTADWSWLRWENRFLGAHIPAATI